MRKHHLTESEKNKLILLREQGLSLPEISITTGVPKTTVFDHVRYVKILPEYESEWFGKRGGSKKIKQRKEQKALEEGISYIKNLSEKEKMLFLAALYWGEGSKKDFGLSNTDPGLIKIFLGFLRDIFKISDEQIQISIRIYEDLDQEECLKFWEGVTSISRYSFINVNIIKGRKKGKLQYGMCRIRVKKGGDLLKKLMGINRALITTMSL